MQNKAPQGKQDPMPTPESELEQYGVWVKAEPQDVVDEPLSEQPTSMTSSRDSEGSVQFVTDDNLVESIEFDETMSDGIEELETLSSIDDLEIIGELPEDLEAFDFETLDQVDSEPLSEPVSESIPEFASDDDALNITLDELDYEEPAEGLESGTIETEKSQGTQFDTTDVNIDDFGFSDTDSTEELPSFDDSKTDKPLAEISEAPHAQDDVSTVDFESLDIDLQFDDTIPADDSAESSESYLSDDESSIDVTADFESVDIDSIGLEVPTSVPSAPAPTPEVLKMETKPLALSPVSMDSFIDLDDGSTPGIIPEMELENVSLNDEAIGFDDVQAVSDELSARPSEPSSDILQKIVLELSSIKEELVSLRGQLSSLKTEARAMPALEEEQEQPTEGVPGGFFDEEDDDTIALTGDELDNILNTADFTEEVAHNDALDNNGSVSLDVSDDIELLPEDGVYETQEIGIETIELPTITPTEEELVSISAQEGVVPITNLPEDTSFLDETEDELSLEFEMPMEDVPLIEPDSSDLESIIDSTFDSENAEIAGLELETEELESEIALDFDSDDEPVISTVDSFPEPMDEIEDALELEEFVEADDLGGLELLAEESELEELEELSLDEESETVSEMDSELLESLTEETEAMASPVVYDSNELLQDQSSDSLVDIPAFTHEIDETETSLEPESTLQEMETFESELPVAAENESSELPTTPVSESIPAGTDKLVPDKLKHDVKSVLLYLDQLLASLPEEKIEEFASSEYYDTYKRLFDDLGLL